MFLLLVQTSRRFKDALAMNESLQRLLELHVAGMNDGHLPSAFPTRDLRRYLHTYQRKWTTFAKVAEHDISQANGHVREISGDTLVQLSGHDRVLVYLLPAMIRNSACLNRWILSNFSHRISSFTVDTSQNLLMTMHVPLFVSITTLR